jgi:GNAT superfamily N-acetyltransferase
MTPEIEELTVPDGPGSPDYQAYCQSLDVRNRNESDVLGDAAPYVDPVEALPYFQDQEQTVKRLFVARLNGEVVGQALLEYSRYGDYRVGWAFGGVLANARHRGVGTALFDVVEREVYASGCTVCQSFVLHGAAGSGTILARSGYGSIPAADDGVRFLTARGYTLEQVSRWNVLHLSGNPAIQQSAVTTAHAVAGSTYRLHAWTGPSADTWLGDLAALYAAMERDAPHADLEVGTTEWTPERVQRQEAQDLAGGRQLLTTVVEHVPSGRLAGFTQLSLPSDPTRPVTQGITIVDPAHRGHRLGLWIKASNLLRLRKSSPDATLVITGNAEENVHMLEINKVLGFQTVGYTGAWKKVLDGSAIGEVRARKV